MIVAVGGYSNISASYIQNSINNNALNLLVSNFGRQSVLGAMNNVFNQALGNALKDSINNSLLPHFIKETASSALNEMMQNRQPTSFEAQSGFEQSSLADLVRNTVMQMVEEAAEEADKKSDGSRSNGGQSWLEVLAGSMAEIQNKFLDRVMESRKDLELAADSTGDDGGQRVFIEAQNDFQAQMQMFKQMTELSSTTIKSVGEALASMARKQ